MALIIPGVEVKVVKEVLAPQLAPSGVLGVVGITEKQPAGGVGRASSWNTFVDLFGAASAFSIPEAAQALANGVFELVVTAVKDDASTNASVDIPADGVAPAALAGDADGTTPKAGKTAKAADTDTAFTLTARSGGTWANGLGVSVRQRDVPTRKDDGTPDVIKVFDLIIQRPGGSDVETHRGLSVNPGDVRYVKTVLAAQSQIVTVSDCKDKLPRSSAEPTPYKLGGGKDAGVSDYQTALDKLGNEPDVDLVLASVQDLSDNTRLSQVYSAVVSHCDRMSSKSQGRIGFGQVPGGNEADIKTNAAALASNLVSDRLVLVAPVGVIGAVAGTIGSLDYFQSPTFKRLALGGVAPALGVETQQELLKENVVPIVSQRGRGIIVVRGLTTDGDQISVRRVADRAVRGVKTIGEGFIGRLNNEEGRGALKQNLMAFLLQMEKDGAVVPSTDGTDPAFKVNVYSSQDDFAKGIVRVDLAVRPVRAIDYIYATVLVQV